MPYLPPSRIAEVLLEILRHGLLTCRVAGWSGDANGCAVEADHLHNFPQLLADYSPDQLQYYWEIERPSFAARISAEERQTWEELWERLQPFVEETASAQN